jgi:hypothetical protein
MGPFKFKKPGMLSYRRISQMGQQLQKSDVRVTSAFPLIATESRTSRDVSSGP